MPAMPRTKNPSWGGRRKGAGRKRQLTFSDRREIASAYFDRMQEDRDLSSAPRREAVIGKLMARFRVTHRMVERCLAEFLSDIRRNTAVYKYAFEVDEIQPLPTARIEKLRP